MKKAVFVDRDGTLNEMVYDMTHGLLDSPRRPDQVKLLPNAGDFLKKLRELGYFIVIATNQPGLAKGTLTEAQLNSVHKKLASLLKRKGGRWDDLRFCPHHPNPGARGNAKYAKKCGCRKPLPGLLVDAAKDHGIDLKQSWMIGDGLVDVQAGCAAGCKTILLTKLKLMQVEQFFDMEHAKPDAIAVDLMDALAIISGKKRTRRQKE